MANNNITIGTNNFDKFKSPWKNKVGVFKTPRGKWIIRVLKNNRPSTISMYDTKEEAYEKYIELTSTEHGESQT